MTLPTILVTGGAGYIGSHVCKALARSGYKPVAYDNLCNGHKGLVRWSILEEGDVRDSTRLHEVFTRHKPQAVIHLAAHIAAGESVEKPWKYYDNNTKGTFILIEAMREAGVKYLVFSSTAAVYGNPQFLPMTEQHPCQPVNPYGSSKYMVEQMLVDYSQVGAIHAVMLRYFNAAGADPESETGCIHQVPHNLIPVVMQVLEGKRKHLDIYGTDYDTPDGTAIRDYIHVSDLADAHVRALNYLKEGGATVALNLGTGKGHSVKEVVAAIEEVTGRKVPVQLAPRRAGDPPMLVADASKAKEVLGWKAAHASLERIVGTVWQWEAHGKTAL